MDTQNKTVESMGSDNKPIKLNKRKMPLLRKLFIISFITLPIIHFCIFYIYVNFNAFLMGFQKTVSGQTIYTTDHFKMLFEVLGNPDGELRLAFKNTLLTFALNLVMYPISIMVSYFLYKKIFGHNVFRCLFYLPSIVSGIVFCFVYRKFVSVGGPVSTLVQNYYKLDLPPSLLANSTFANTYVLLHHFWVGFPGAMLIWSGTFSRIPDSVLEYAKIDGCNWVRELVQLIIPMVWPTFMLFMVMQFTGIFSATGAVFLLTGGLWNTQTLSNWFYMQVYSVSVHPTSNTLNYMSAVGLMLTIVAFTISMIVRKGLVKLVPEVDF